MFVKNVEHDVIATIMELIFVPHSKEFMDMKQKFQQRLNALTRYTPFLLLIKDSSKSQYYVCGDIVHFSKGVLLVEIWLSHKSSSHWMT